MLLALGAGTALASAGRALIERAGAPRTGARLTRGPRRPGARDGSRGRRRIAGGNGGGPGGAGAAPPPPGRTPPPGRRARRARTPPSPAAPPPPPPRPAPAP